MALDPTLLLCIVGGIILVGIIIIANAIRIVPEYQRLVVFRLGRCVGEKGPGIVLLLPVIDRAVRSSRLMRTPAAMPVSERARSS